MLKRLSERRPSAATAIALVALVLAATGTAVAASHLVKGDKLIKKHSLSGNRLRNHTITGKQVNLKKLGKVPSASHADEATHAGSADNATTLGGKSSSVFLPSGSRIGTPGIVKVSGTTTGNTVTLFTVGPFTVKLTCTKDAAGNVSSSLTASSGEPNSVIDNNLVPAANTSVSLGLDLGPDTAFSEDDNVNIDFEAPSGAQAVLPGATGINSLGADCWSNWAGIH
jgi:hypothetical protein